MYQLDHIGLWHNNPTVPLKRIIREEIFPVNAQLQCSNYKWQPHVLATSSHHQAVYVRSIKGNHIPVVYI